LFKLKLFQIKINLTITAGTLVESFNIRQEDVTPNSLSLLFRLVKDSIYLTTEANEVIFQDSSRDTNFPYLYGEEYFVNGDDEINNTSQVSMLTNGRITKPRLNTWTTTSTTTNNPRIACAAKRRRTVGGLNNGFQMGFDGPSSSFERINTVC
jgi:hypothetical protein